MTDATFSTRLESMLLLVLLFLQAGLLAASPAPPALEVSRRAGQLPEFRSDYEGRVKKGEYLRGLMLLGKGDAQSLASPFQDPNDAARWGWTLSADWFPFKHAPESSKYLQEAFKDPALQIDETQAGEFTYYHNKIFDTKNGEKGEITGAAYTNSVNPTAGAFVFYNNISPAYIVKEYGLGTVPDLYALSDFAVFQWLKGCQHTKADPKNLKVVFRTNVIYKPTTGIVIDALKEAGYKRVPGWKDHAKINHKAVLGAKKIDEMVVWGGYRSQQNGPMTADEINTRVLFYTWTY
ncbi:hypothetical protein LX32DRAFT_658389 [Colletotrichum zoysiae]|uniref:Uncharacterized protein n=1 Tax=Colletotrichum zoysiae TaxID=1216348 RepID=A0AAD9LUC4_9PEZI|nr:hypothetical protein LX32DRAFT_658389 [Colletotrichum zoysiae]